MSVGLVLGAGGPMGWPFHLGVIEGIRCALGREPADADIIVGTSAGGAVAASLLAGAGTTDVLDAINQPFTADQQQRMRDARESVVRRPWRLGRPQSPAMIRAGGITGLVGLAPAGVFPTFAIRRFPLGRHTTWPPRLWLPAVQLGTGATVVFGRDVDDVSVADAVEATSAVPGLFQPKTIGDHRYVDGAVASASHAHLLVEHRLDTIVISSPMTRPGRGPIKQRARRQLAAEIAILTANSANVVLVEPTEHIVDLAKGYPRITPSAGPGIVDAARLHTIQALTSVSHDGPDSPTSQSVGRDRATD